MVAADGLFGFGFHPEALAVRGWINRIRLITLMVRIGLANTVLDLNRSMRSRGLIYICLAAVVLSLQAAAVCRADSAEIVLQSYAASDVNTVSWSPDGTTLAASYGDGTIRLWDPRQHTSCAQMHLLRTIVASVVEVRSVAWSPDGKRLASAGADGTVKLWDAEGGKLLATLSGHKGWVNGVAWSPDGRRLAAATGLSILCGDPDREWPRFATEFVNLPGTEWISFRPAPTWYCGSLQCDQFAGLRFNQQLKPIYPLYYYRDQLKRDDLLTTEPPPALSPKPLRLWWDTFDNKEAWAGALTGALAGAVSIYLVARKRSNPLASASEFFKEAGSTRQQRLAPDLLRIELAAPDGNAGEAGVSGVVALWNEPRAASLFARLQKHGGAGRDRTNRLYLLHDQVKPPPKILQQWRRDLGCEVIPVHTRLMKRAVTRHESERVLNEVEEPYVVRRDPYLESKPILDPTWFFGREEILARLTSVLSQGQHAGLFGLRKIGKTSLIQQIQQRLDGTPTVFLDCQAFGDSSGEYLNEIIRQLIGELALFGVRSSPALVQETDDVNTLRKHLLDLFELWRAAGRHQPFLIIMDEIDKLFPCEDLAGGEATLKEYVRLFRILRGLAQTKHCLVLLVVAYRPDVNRRNLLTVSAGENPMFSSYQEEYLGFLKADESASLLREIGQWRQIEWEPEALEVVYGHCGGHPLVTRIFASEATEKGSRKRITAARAEEVAAQIANTFWKNSIGNYYSEGIWNTLRADEQDLLDEMITVGGNGLEQDALARSGEALTNLENFGLIRSEGGRFQVGAQLFRKWLEARY